MPDAEGEQNHPGDEQYTMYVEAGICLQHDSCIYSIIYCYV